MVSKAVAVAALPEHILASSARVAVSALPVKLALMTGGSDNVTASDPLNLTIAPLLVPSASCTMKFLVLSNTVAVDALPSNPARIF